MNWWKINFFSLLDQGGNSWRFTNQALRVRYKQGDRNNAMENERSGNASDEPNRKRPKIESGGSTSAKPKTKDPFLTMPSDVFAKIIGYIPIAQWPALELVDKNFRATTMIAYRQLRNLNVGRDLLIKFGKTNPDLPTITKSIESISQKFIERSPFLKSLGGMHLRADTIPLLAQFEHLQSICLGDADFFTSQCGVRLEYVVDFLESTGGRTSLKELRLYNVVQSQLGRATILDRFAASFNNGREIHTPLKLETFSFASVDGSLRIRLDTMDTTRLSDVRLGNASIEPQQLTNLIERASELRTFELSFLVCDRVDCNGPRLQANKKLLVALSSHEKLTALKFDSINSTNCACMNFVPEFVEMLRIIGHRGQLRKLAIEDKLFDRASAINLAEICVAISAYIPSLQSIKLHTSGINHANVFNIVSLPELEEIDVMNSRIPVLRDTIKKIAQLSRLRRLALPGLKEVQFPSSYTYLADIPTLKDLRIGDASMINADTFEKWADGFASNLECFMIWRIRDEDGLIRLLEKAVRLRVLIIQGRVTDRSLKAIAQSCPQLETLGVQSHSYRYSYLLPGVSVRGLQEVVDHCPKLNRLGGFKFGVNMLQMENYRKIVRDLDMEFWKYDFDDVYD